MSLWDDLPPDLRNNGSLDSLEPLLDSVATPSESEESDADGNWKVYRTSVGDDDPLSLDPSTGEFRRGPGTGSTPLEFPDPRVGIELRLHLDGPGGSPDGWVRLLVSTPRAVIRLPFLRGAQLDAQGQLRPDPRNREVKFHVPAIRVQVEKRETGGMAVELLSATTTGTPVDQIYEFVRMEPAHALVGPGNTFGFAFRSAVLDLAGTAGPSGVPAGAVAMPTNWQGFYLPEARMFVSPDGLEGLAVSGGVRDLWIGIGDHAGVTGVFEAELVNRGCDPTVRLRFQTPTGEWIGVSDPDPTTPVQLPEETRLYVDAGGGLAPLRIEMEVDGTLTVSDRVDVVTPSSGAVSIEVEVTDAGSRSKTRSISAVRRSTNGAATAPGGAPDVAITPTSTGPGRIELVSSTATHAVVRLDPSGGSIDWSWPGGTSTGDTATIPVAEGATVPVTARRTLPTTIDCFMRFDRPKADEGLQAFTDNPSNTRTEQAGTRDDWAGGVEFREEYTSGWFALYPAGTTWSIDGYASFEGDDSQFQRERNEALSGRRRDVMVTILRDKLGLDAGVSEGPAHGHAVASGSQAPPSYDARTFPPGSPAWWRATATATIPGAPTETVTADLERPTTPPPLPDVDPAPTQEPKPDCFRKLGARVELIRNTFVRAEIYGEFDFHTAAEQRLGASGAGPLPPRTNPSDGISTFLVRLRIAEDRASWDVSAEFRAVEGDLDGLAKSEVSTPGSSAGLNVLGAVSALSPLLAAAAPPSPREGELVPLVVASAAALGIGASGVMDVKHVILRGGELLITDGLVDPATGSGPNTTQVSILLDLETAFTFDLGFIRVRPESPIVTRYKATGFRSTWSSAPQPDGTAEYVPLPVFDPSRGYTLDVPAGSLMAADPLGEILRILGVQVARDNPTYLEVEVGMGVDLGIVSVDTARVRLRLDQTPEPPQLTKLGASLEIPGTLHGKGVVEITPAGFKGAFDLTVEPLSLRASAVLAVESRSGVTGVLVGAEVEFPLPLVLGNSGLGIFGFMGGVGVNYARNEPTGVNAPALRWLEDQLRRPGNVMAPEGWSLTPGVHAFAAGVLVGTLEGGYIVHLKGVVLIELPGPRLLLIMKADVLKAPPVLDSDQSATFLAVLDIDFGRGTITVGVVAQYEIAKLVEIRLPVTAFFNTNDTEDWFVYLGTFVEPVTVEVLDVLRGVGYLMIRGNGIPGLPLPVVTSGLTVAVGFHFEAVLMGSKSTGLYLEVAAGFDAVVSFEPFAIGGRIYARGELRLFIVSIGASAELIVLVGKHVSDSGVETDRTYVHGEVCGKVDFFFFSVEGCVSLTIGEEPDPIPEPPDLVAGVSLVSRSPALMEGSAIDRAVDGKLADALGEDETGDLPTVPLDAIPVVMFHSPTDEASGDIVLGGEARGANGLPANPWLQRGDRWWRYRITGVELIGPLAPADGKTPATWWARGLPGDTSHGPALALLNWLPDPTPRAVTYGERLITRVRERWGTVCLDAAPPARILWTFDRKPLGPSASGWRLTGVVWPDDPDAYRSSPADTVAGVDEPWRCGDEMTDRVQGIDPAVVVGDAVPCERRKGGEVVESLDVWIANQPDSFSNRYQPTDSAGAGELAELLADGVPLSDVAPARAEQAWDPEYAEQPWACEGRILRSPRGDDARPAGGRDIEAEQVAETWGQAGFEPSELANSIRLRSAAGLEELTLLLLLPLERSEEGLMLRYRKEDGALIGEETVTSTALVSGANPVPPEWTDPSGPWADPVERAGMIAARVASASPDLHLHLVECGVPGGTVEVEMGWQRDAFAEGRAPLFYLVAATAVTASERVRHDWDHTTTTRERELIETTLTQDPDDHALLVPGEEYRVRVTWQGVSLQQDASPAANATVDWASAATGSQEFRFAADGANEAPSDLSPWLLASTPAAEEMGVLCREPVRIALATQNVAKLFAAYGEELRVVVRSASGRHPTPPNGSGPGAPVTIPVALSEPADPNPNLLQPLQGSVAVMTPFEAALHDVASGLRCIPEDVDREHHHVLTISYDFDPLTEYLLDIRAVPIGSPETTVGRRVHRFSFSTSRFDTVEDLARLVLLNPITQTHVTSAAPLHALGDRPSGADLDAAFQAAGLSIPTTPRYPGVDVLWSGETTPQPVAVVIDSSEPLWRERPMPEQVSDAVSGEAPPHTWWAAVETAWLRPEVETAPPAVGDLPRATVERIIRGPGDSRAVILLASGARGSELLVNLFVPTNPLYGDPEQKWPIFGMHLRQAPWETSP